MPTIEILNPDTYTWLNEKAEEKDTSFRKYVNNFLDLEREKEKFIEKYMPKIKKVKIHEGSLILEDKDLADSYVKIGLANGLIHCYKCDKEDCKHIIYTMTLPDIASLL